MSTSLVEQLQSILDVTEDALKSIGSSHLRTLYKQTRLAEKERSKAALREKQSDDGLDRTAGVKSDLNMEDKLLAVDAHLTKTDSETPAEERVGKRRKSESAEDDEAVQSLPIVIIKNFERGPGPSDELLSVLAKWAARLSEHQVCSFLFTHFV